MATASQFFLSPYEYLPPPPPIHPFPLINYQTYSPINQVTRNRDNLVSISGFSDPNLSPMPKFFIDPGIITSMQADLKKMMACCDRIINRKFGYEAPKIAPIIARDVSQSTVVVDSGKSDEDNDFSESTIVDSGKSNDEECVQDLQMDSFSSPQDVILNSSSIVPVEESSMESLAIHTKGNQFPDKLVQLLQISDDISNVSSNNFTHEATFMCDYGLPNAREYLSLFTSCMEILPVQNVRVLLVDGIRLFFLLGCAQIKEWPPPRVSTSTFICVQNNSLASTCLSCDMAYLLDQKIRERTNLTPTAKITSMLKQSADSVGIVYSLHALPLQDLISTARRGSKCIMYNDTGWSRVYPIQDCIQLWIQFNNDTKVLEKSKKVLYIVCGDASLHVYAEEINWWDSLISASDRLQQLVNVPAEVSKQFLHDGYETLSAPYVHIAAEVSSAYVCLSALSAPHAILRGFKTTTQRVSYYSAEGQNGVFLRHIYVAHTLTVSFILHVFYFIMGMMGTCVFDPGITEIMESVSKGFQPDFAQIMPTFKWLFQLKVQKFESRIHQFRKYSACVIYQSNQCSIFPYIAYSQGEMQLAGGKSLVIFILGAVTQVCCSWHDHGSIHTMQRQLVYIENSITVVVLPLHYGKEFHIQIFQAFSRFSLWNIPCFDLGMMCLNFSVNAHFVLRIEFSEFNLGTMYLIAGSDELATLCVCNIFVQVNLLLSSRHTREITETLKECGLMNIAKGVVILVHCLGLSQALCRLCLTPSNFRSYLILPKGTKFDGECRHASQSWNLFVSWKLLWPKGYTSTLTLLIETVLVLQVLIKRTLEQCLQYQAYISGYNSELDRFATHLAVLRTVAVILLAVKGREKVFTGNFEAENSGLHGAPSVQVWYFLTDTFVEWTATFNVLSGCTPIKDIRQYGVPFHTLAHLWVIAISVGSLLLPCCVALIPDCKGSSPNSVTSAADIHTLSSLYVGEDISVTLYLGQLLTVAVRLISTGQVRMSLQWFKHAGEESQLPKCKPMMFVSKGTLRTFIWRIAWIVVGHCRSIFS